jgi:hypothetical protein
MDGRPKSDAGTKARTFSLPATVETYRPALILDIPKPAKATLITTFIIKAERNSL